MKRMYCILLIIILLSTVFFTGNLSAVEEIEVETIGSENYKGAYRYNIQGWIYLYIKGEPYERGYQHGYLLAYEIVDQIQRWKYIFPQKHSWEIHRSDALRLFWRKYPEEYKQEIKGIADGVTARGVDLEGNPITYKDILAINEMYEMLSRYRHYYLRPLYTLKVKFDATKNKLKSTGPSLEEFVGKCSVFIATGDATKDGRIVASHSTRGMTLDTAWWHMYVSERWNVLVDLTPKKGNRILYSTAPGMIWSNEDYYQNDAGMILMETTLKELGAFKRRGDPLVVRARKAIQYSDSIDEMVNFLKKNNNGLFANDWVMGDTKTGEIASLELGLYNYALKRTKNGFLWSNNNVKDDEVRKEMLSRFGFGILNKNAYGNGIFVGNPAFVPKPRDIMFEEFGNKYYGEIDVDIVKKIMSTDPISFRMYDCKITDTKLLDNFGLWAFMGYVNGSDFIAIDAPLDRPTPGYTDMPVCGWIQLYGLLTPNKYQINKAEINSGKNGKKIWEFETKIGEFGNAIYSSCEFLDERIYITSWSGDIYIIDVNSGELLKDKNLGWCSESTPLVVVDKVFVGSSNGLYALDKEINETLWKKEIGTVSTKPAFLDDVVYCSSHDGNIYAFDSKSGNLEWYLETDGEIHSSPTIYNDVLFVGSNDKYLYAIDVDNGELKWKHKTEGAICSTPTILNDIVYFGSWDNNLYALNSETGELEWKFTTGWGIDSSPEVKDDFVYVGCEDNNFYAIDAEGGKLKWIFNANAGIKSSPTAYGGYVFFGSDDGYIYAINSSNGKLVWKEAPDYFIEGIDNFKTRPIVSSPIAYDGKIFVGSTNGKIYCFDAQTYEIIIEDVEIPMDTWVFIIVPLLLIIFTTILYLYLDRRKNH